jgi:hypothetical protein
MFREFFGCTTHPACQRDNREAGADKQAVLFPNCGQTRSTTATGTKISSELSDGFGNDFILVIHHVTGTQYNGSVLITTGVARQKISISARSRCPSPRLYTTTQVAAALYGSMDVEKLKTQRQITRLYELENAITEGNVLNRTELAKGLAGIADAMTSRIMSCEALPRSAREDILRDLATLPLILEGVAHSQSRLPSRHNAKHHEVDESDS